MTWKHLYTENLRLKLLATGIALALWLHVNYGGDSEIDLKVPVSTSNVPVGMNVVKVEPAAVDIRIVGPKIMMRQLHAGRSFINLDLSGVVVGNTTFATLEKMIDLPRAFQVVRVSPSTVTVKVARPLQ